MKSKSASAVHLSPYQKDLTFSALPILCFSHLRWHFVTQRPQHLLRRAAANRTVFFWEEPIWHERVEPEAAGDKHESWLEVLQEGDAITILRPHLCMGMDATASQRTLLDTWIAGSSITRYITWFYTPMALAFCNHLAPELTVYDCMDELTGFLGAPPELQAREQELFRTADVVFTGGISLYEVKRHQHKNVHAFPSSIDVAHFAQAKSSSPDHLIEPTDQASIAHPRAGFYGVVDERFDIELLRVAAARKPAIHFVILGPVVKIDPAALPQAPNIHYLGGKSYNELPQYLAGWEVALLPFAMNAATRFISPTKTPEYLAAGKPVVSTPIPDVVLGYGAEGLVQIAETPEAFADLVEQALAPAADAWRTAVESKLAQGSWDRTWASMLDRMRQAWLTRRGSAVEVSIANSRTDRPTTGKPLVKSSHTGALVGAQPRITSALRRERFDYLVAGAGFAGSVLAERLATQSGKKVLVVDTRTHIAGNAYDFYNADGILIHKYGPHIFHTNSDKVVDYLSQFTEWRPYEHRVLSSVDGQLLPVPINLDTINQLYGLALDAPGMQLFLASRTITPAVIRTSEDVVLSRVGRELYEKFFRNYTRKQWGLDPAQLDASVAGRIPVRFDRDNRYFTDSFQAMPLHGYTRMFERMLDQPGITIRTGTSFRDAQRVHPEAKIIFTGAIDEYFDYRFGPLPYRSLEFKHETRNQETFQPAPVVNYPNDHDYTRVTEFKYLTGQKHAKTSIVYEYPRAEGDPYYPIPRPANAALYRKYQELAEKDGSVCFCGRLANYRYFNMDQVVAQALGSYARLAQQEERILPAKTAAIEGRIAI